MKATHLADGDSGNQSYEQEDGEHLKRLRCHRYPSQQQHQRQNEEQPSRGEETKRQDHFNRMGLQHKEIAAVRDKGTGAVDTFLTTTFRHRKAMLSTDFAAAQRRRYTTAAKTRSTYRPAPAAQQSG